MIATRLAASAGCACRRARSSPGGSGSRLPRGTGRSGASRPRSPSRRSAAEPRRSTRWARTAASVSAKPDPALRVGIATVTAALMLDYPPVRCSAPSRQQRRSALDSGVSRLLGASRRCWPSSSVSGLRGRCWCRHGSRPTSSRTSPTRRAWQRASRSRGSPADWARRATSRFADASVGASRGAFWPQAAPPDWSRADYDAYLAASMPPTAAAGQRIGADQRRREPAALLRCTPQSRTCSITAAPRSDASTRCGSPVSCCSSLTTLARVAPGRRGVRSSPPASADLRRRRRTAADGHVHVHCGQSRRAAHHPVDARPVARRAA